MYESSDMRVCLVDDSSGVCMYRLGEECVCVYVCVCVCVRGGGLDGFCVIYIIYEGNVCYICFDILHYAFSF